MPNVFDPEFDATSDRPGFAWWFVAGRPSLRTPDSERELETGEVVAFPVGERGAHQVVNRTSEPAKVLLVSEMNAE